MSVFEKHTKSPAEVHEICLNNCKAKNCAECSFVSWVPREIAIKAVFDKNMERFAEITKLEEELALYKTSDIDLAKKVDHAFLANYLTSLKWTDRGDMHGKQVLTFQWLEHYKDERTESTTLRYQIDIPVSPLYSDYDSSIVRAADELAQFLNQERKQVLVNLVLACFSSKQTTEAKP